MTPPAVRNSAGSLRRGLAAAVFIWSCCCAQLGAQAPVTTPQNAPARLPLQAASSPLHDRESPPTCQQHATRYLLQPMDVLQVSFPLSPELNQSLTVQPDGYVNLQAAAPLHVQGMTIEETEAALHRAYTGTLHDPIINVDLKDFQKPFFSVTGQVGRPGRFDLRGDTTVNEAVAMAGGLAPTAKMQIFLLRRTSCDWFEVTKLNLKDILHGKHASEDVLVRSGDLIYVPETFITGFKKYVPYSVSSYVGPNPL